jgi:hypothetical protein
MGKSSRPQSARVGGPGPGDYGYAPTSPTGAASFGRAPRSPAADARAAAGPGPADYDSLVAQSYLRPSSARAVIGNATRGALSPQSASAEVPIYSPTFDAVQPVSPRQVIGKSPRFQKSENQNFPGPGAFNLPPSPSGPAYTIRAR